jgi:hypothetical protein
MTVFCECENAPGFTIRKASPIIGKFVGQPIENLKGWMSKQGGFRIVELAAVAPKSA